MLQFQISQKHLTPLCLCVIVSMSILNITVRNNIQKKKFTAVFCSFRVYYICVAITPFKEK